MSKENKSYKIENPDNITEYKYSNTHKISFNETDLFIDYGSVVPDEETIRINSKIAIPISTIQHFIVNLFIAAQEYEKQYNKDIGFGNIKDNDESSKKQD